VAAEHPDENRAVDETTGESLAPRRARGELGETVGAFDAKTHLSWLLDEVRRGKTITITRRGIPVAVLAPPEAVHGARSAAGEQEREEGVRQAIEAWRRYRDAQPQLRATVAEILAWVKEGRR
jgi:prevent-host-death family protein